jgi:SRSO17 transposase
MDAQAIRDLEPSLNEFLSKFGHCFPGVEARGLSLAYLRGLLSSIERKNVERIALNGSVAPRTLQEFLSSYPWNEHGMRSQLYKIVANDHHCVNSVGIIDETSHVKKGTKTPGVQRQYCGAVGKQENCIITVDLSYEAQGFRCLLDSELFLPESWSNDRERCNAAGIPEAMTYRPKSDIALELYARAKSNGIHFEWLTFDEWYGAKPQFLDALVRDNQKFVAEIHQNHRVWGEKPNVASRPYRKNGRKSKKTPRLASGSPKAMTVKELVESSSTFQKKRWTRWHVKDTEKGPKVVECKTMIVYPQNTNGLPSVAHILLVVRDVLTEEVKYFLSFAPLNTSTNLLIKVAFSRWSVERWFEDSKKYIGLDHYEGRCYLGLMRHLILCAVSLLFLSTMRLKLTDKYPELTVSQVRQATSALVLSWWQPEISADATIREAARHIEYYQRRNMQARKSHSKTRIKQLESLGIDMDSIRRCEWADG